MGVHTVALVQSHPFALPSLVSVSVTVPVYTWPWLVASVSRFELSDGNGTWGATSGAALFGVAVSAEPSTVAAEQLSEAQISLLLALVGTWLAI